MYKITIINVGKTKESWLNDALSEYETRLKPFAKIEWLFAKNDVQLISLSKPPFIILDPNGEKYNTNEFYTFLMKSLEQNRSHLTFIIGGPEGIPMELKEKATHSLSLSSLTFTHQLTRLILLEQIYRGMQIHQNSPYHK